MTVEPNASVRDLTAFLVPRGFTLAVTLEIGDATAGGLALGVGMTTHSHKVSYRFVSCMIDMLQVGLYQETVLSYEVVLPDGRLVVATESNEFADLFRCLPWSHGTLAFLTALELKLVRVKPFVHLKYIPVSLLDRL